MTNSANFIDRNTVQYTRKFSTPIETVWQTLSKKTELEKWFMCKEIEPKTGGRFKFMEGWEGWIGEFSNHNHIQFNTSDQSYTRFEIYFEANTTYFKLIDKLRPDMPLPDNLPPVKGVDDHILRNQPGGIGTHWSGIIAGWHGYVDALDTLLTGYAPPLNYPELCHAYNVFLEDYWK